MQQTIAKLQQNWRKRLEQLEDDINYLQGRGYDSDAHAKVCEYNAVMGCLEELEEWFPEVKLTRMNWTTYGSLRGKE